MMHVRRPELRVLTVTILLGTLALALAVVIGYGWWSTQRNLSHRTQEKVDLITQFLENGMALLPQDGADLDGLYLLLEGVGEDSGLRHLRVMRGAAVSRQYGPSSNGFLPDGQVQRVFQTGQGVTRIEKEGKTRVVRRVEPLIASSSCTSCHDVAPGEILGVLDLSFDLARVRSPDPDFYRNLLLVALLVSVISVLLVFLLFSRVHMARRIEGVAALAGDIAAGNLDRRVAPLPGSDMDGLAQAINEMAASLQSQQEALARQRRELEEANRRLEVLVQEAHHRIKNNLQTVADLLALQAADCPMRGGSCLQDSIQRVKSIAAVHELLSVEQAERTDIRTLAERLLQMAVRNVAAPDQRIGCEVTGDPLFLPSKQATALALVLGELFNNALHHGLAGRPKGHIAVRIATGEGMATLTVRDDGGGLPPDFAWERCQRLGLRIVRTLVRRELGGDVILRSADGTEAVITWPLS